MNKRISLLTALSVAAVLYAPFHYSWRWEGNDQLFRDDRISKDDWVADQILIPIEAWGLGAAGVIGAGVVIWSFIRKKGQVPLYHGHTNGTGCQAT
jgi:hypothetical protein